MKAGFAEKDITPPKGTERAGNYVKNYIGSVRDPLKARASVFDDGVTLAAIVGVDTCEIQKSTVSRARTMIFESCGIKPENIMIAASHTHSGGSLFGFHKDDLEDAPELIKKLALELSPSIDVKYEEMVIANIHEAVLEAYNKRQDVLMSVGSGFEYCSIFNRRCYMKSGGICTHPGKGNPDILKTAGPTDPEVGVIGAWTPEGKLGGCIVNFACHATTYAGVIASADWICAMEKTIRGCFGNDAIVVFLNGAAGDVTQIDNIVLRKNRKDEDFLNLIGMRVGAEAVKVLVTAEKGIFEPVNVISKKIKAKRRIKDLKKTEAALSLMNAFIKENKPLANDYIWAKERVIADYIAKNEPEREFEIQAIQLGPALFLANPSELFCKLGLKIKKACKHFPFTFVVELTNDSIGYVPDADAFGANGGGYETRLTSCSDLEINTGEEIVKTSISLAKKLKPGKIPEIPLETEQGQPWAYGNNTPELD